MSFLRPWPSRRLFLALATYSRSGISPSGGTLRLFTLSLADLLLLFFPGLFRRLFGLGALLGLVGLTLWTLWGYGGFWGSFRLIVSGIEAHL